MTNVSRLPIRQASPPSACKRAYCRWTWQRLCNSHIGPAEGLQSSECDVREQVVSEIDDSDVLSCHQLIHCPEV